MSDLEACTSEWFVNQEPSSIFSPFHMSSLFDNLFTEEQREGHKEQWHFYFSHLI